MSIRRGISNDPTIRTFEFLNCILLILGQWLILTFIIYLSFRDKSSITICTRSWIEIMTSFSTSDSVPATSLTSSYTKSTSTTSSVSMFMLLYSLGVEYTNARWEVWYRQESLILANIFVEFVVKSIKGLFRIREIVPTFFKIMHQWITCGYFKPRSNKFILFVLFKVWSYPAAENT